MYAARNDLQSTDIVRSRRWGSRERGRRGSHNCEAREKRPNRRRCPMRWHVRHSTSGVIAQRWRSQVHWRPSRLARIREVSRIGPRVALLVVGLSLAGCSHAAILDQSPIRNYVVFTIVNDSPSSVEVTECWAKQCTTHDLTDSIRPGSQRDVAINNAQAGTAIFRVTSGKTVRCFRIRYARDQEHHDPVAVSSARACPWTR